MLKKIILLELLFFCIVSISCFAIIPPKPFTSIYCQDLANVLTDRTKLKINSISHEINLKTGVQIVVLVVPSLNGINESDYALDVFRTWGIGNKEKNNGILILLALKERKSRIEVGYGLEGALPDGKVGRIIDEYMVPALKQEQYDTAVRQGYKEISQIVAQEYKIFIRENKNKTVESKGFSILTMLIFSSIIILLLVFDWIFLGGALTLIILSILFRRGGGGEGGGFGDSGHDNLGGGSSGGGGTNRSW